MSASRSMVCHAVLLRTQMLADTSAKHSTITYIVLRLPGINTSRNTVSSVVPLRTSMISGTSTSHNTAIYAVHFLTRIIQA